MRFTEIGLDVVRIAGEWTPHLGERRMRQLREPLTVLREITDP
ncbi:MAG TPA: hypothetical protein VJ777_24595 [Mycobacterium sp.]|nr:hypothetical protein [Mycobacterium sp.]